MSSSIDPFALTAEQYLARHHIGIYFKDAVSQLLEYKEENSKLNPVNFFYEYFSSVIHGNHTLFRDYAFIEATPRNRASFIRNVWKCFQHIGRNGDLLNIKEYHSLVCLLCPDFPFEVLQKTARIILIDDAMDCLVSFSDFLYAFQVQFYYQEFLEKCLEVYQSTGNDLQYQMDHNSLPLTDVESDLCIRVESKEMEGMPHDVNSKRFMERLSKDILNKQSLCTFSCPSDDALREILMSASRVSFYGFLIALTKSEVINKTVGVLPDKPSLIDIADQETPLTTPRSASSRVRNTGTIKKGSK